MTYCYCHQKDTLAHGSISNAGVPIVSITPRATDKGYLPLLQDPALAQLADLTVLGFGGSSTDATSLVLTMPRAMVNTTAAAITVTEPYNGEVTIPPAASTPTPSTRGRSTTTSGAP